MVKSLSDERSTTVIPHLDIDASTISMSQLPIDHLNNDNSIDDNLTEQKNDPILAHYINNNLIPKIEIVQRWYRKTKTHKRLRSFCKFILQINKFMKRNRNIKI